MIFLLKLLILVAMGWLLGLFVGVAFSSPLLGISAFLLWCVSNRTRTLS